MKIKLILNFFASLVFLFTSTFAYARVGEGVGGRPQMPLNDNYKSWFMYELKPGENYNDVMKVLNTTDETWTVYVYPTDWISSAGAGFSLKQRSESMEEMGNWITLSADKMTLDPGESKDLPFRISIPSNASPDEICGGIAVEKVAQDSHDGSLGIKLSTRNVVRVYNNFEDGKTCKGNKRKKKVDICHRTAKFPYPTIDISVAESAVQTHLDHGDDRGPCTQTHKGPRPKSDDDEGKDDKKDKEEEKDEDNDEDNGVPLSFPKENEKELKKLKELLEEKEDEVEDLEEKMKEIKELKKEIKDQNDDLEEKDEEISELEEKVKEVKKKS